MNSKETILNKLKKAKVSNQSQLPGVIYDKDIFRDYPDSDSLLGLFTKKFKALNGELHIADNIEKAAEQLDSIITTLNEKRCLTYSSDLPRSILSYIPNTLKYFDFIENKKLDSQNFASYTSGLTTADFLIARTGSIVLNSLIHGGRRLSVLPPIHIVVAKTNQIIFSLDGIFSKDFTSSNWSHATIISGPSRTSDIEKQLVLGAHGPKRLIVILIENL